MCWIVRWWYGLEGLEGVYGGMRSEMGRGGWEWSRDVGENGVTGLGCTRARGYSGWGVLVEGVLGLVCTRARVYLG